MMRRLKYAAFAAVLAAAVVSGTALAKTKIAIAELNWTGAIAIEHILGEILATYFDAEVTFVPLDPPIAWAALDKGDGNLDISPDMWEQLNLSEIGKYAAPGSRESVLLSAHPYVGTEGLFIPGYLQDEHGIRTVQDLADPEIAKLFDTDGDGMGEWWPGSFGWGTTDMNLVRAKTYGFDKYFKPHTFEQWVMEAQLDAAHKRKRGFLLYFWEPEWLHKAYDLRKLEESPYSPDCHKFVRAIDDPNWLENSSISCANKPTNIHVIYSKAFAQRAADVVDFINRLQFTTKMVNGWIFAISYEKQNPSAMAKAWVAANKDMIEKEWLGR